MTEQLQELIERINLEGVEAADSKSKEIVSAAEEKAEKIVSDAEKAAENLTKNAEAEAKKLQENAEKAIRQSFRNIMLSLQDEIRKYFDRIFNAEIGESLTTDKLGEVILAVGKRCADQISGAKDVAVLVSPDDAKKLAESLIERFKRETGKGLKIKPVPSVDAGFMISFDGGESSYDFTDQGLQQLLSTYISGQLKKIISQ
jgi:V/A-type H+/Na+-transporting ATPase subunit E